MKPKTISQRYKVSVNSTPINWEPANLFDLPSRFDSRCAVDAAPWLTQLVDQQLPVPGSNRGYRQGTIFNNFMLLFHEGGRCLDDVSHLEKEKPLMELLGCGQLPGAKTLGNWLRRVGRSAQGMQGLVNINKTILAAALYKRKQITLDIDATVIESNKRNAQFTYKKHRGYTPMVGHIGETG